MNGQRAADPQHAEGARSADRSGLLLVIAGVVGFGLGVAFAEWQVAVETAQVVAGLVEYPADNPFFIYHVKLWTILHQACALLLSVGVSEAVVSKLLSGLIGLVSFQALSLLAYALSRSIVFSLGSVLVVLVGGSADFGVVYPIFLLGTSHTYGALGLSYIVLAAAVVGSGRYRSGAFLFGLAPAVHPSLGAWSITAAALAVAWDLGRSRREFLAALPYFIAGGVVTAASLGVHLILQPTLPDVAQDTAARYLWAFVSFWDGHRAPVRFKSIGVMLNGCALALALIWLRWFAHDLPRPATFVLRYVIVSAAIALGVALLSQLPPQRLPMPLLVLMPARWLNIAVVVNVALLFGLLGAYRQTVTAYLLAAALAVGLLLAERSWLWQLSVRAWFDRAWRLEDGHVFVLIQLVSAGAVVLALIVRRHAAGSVAARQRVLAIRVTMAVLVGVFAFAGVLSYLRSRAPDVAERFDEEPSDRRLLAVARLDQGMLVTAGDLHLIQLRTRRPVLIDGGGLDGLPYALEAAPLTDRILRDVYDVDLFNPPPEAQGSGRIPPRYNRARWESYSLERWQQIRRRFGVTQVFTFSGWTLQLPTVIGSTHYHLYAIPE